MMNKWDSLGWDDFLANTKDKRIVLWGAGTRCSKILPYFKRKFDDIIVVDRYKSGQYIDREEIFPPEILKDMKNVAVLACGMYANEIRKELFDINKEIPCYSEYWIEHRYYIDNYSRIQTDIDLARVKNLCSLFEDEQSRIVYESIIEKRLNGVVDYGDIMSDVGYFPREIFELDNNEVFVDCGAFNGDTIKEFIDSVEDFERIIAYEADPANCERITHDMIYCFNRDHIDLFNYAVSDSEKELCLNSGIGASSYISNSIDSSFAPKDLDVNPISIKSVSLDNHIKSIIPSFIKMDIEGSELEALRGAQRIIKEYHPNLAICIYHKKNDLFDIPELIHSLVPEYKLYIRHQGCLYFDTILFAKSPDQKNRV